MNEVTTILRFTQKAALALCCGFLLTTGTYAAASAETLDQIVAVVNDDVITKSELDHAIDMTKLQMTQQSTALPAPSELRKQVLNQLTDKKLELQIAKQSGVVVTDAELDDALQKIASQNHATLSELYDQLGTQGLNVKDYRSEIRDQMTMRKIQQQQIMSHIVVSPIEVDRYMKAQSWLIKGSDKEYHLEDILVPIPDAPTTADINNAKARAQTIVARINKGETFQSIAAQSSTGANALQGGDLGWRKLPEIPTAFAKPVANMKLHDIAGPIQTENGFHIIRLTELRDSAAQDKPSRQQIENMLFERKFNEAVQTWISKLRGSSFISMNLSGKGQTIIT